MNSIYQIYKSHKFSNFSPTITIYAKKDFDLNQTSNFFVKRSTAVIQYLQWAVTRNTGLGNFYIWKFFCKHSNSAHAVWERPLTFLYCYICVQKRLFWTIVCWRQWRWCSRGNDNCYFKSDILKMLKLKENLEFSF